MSQVERNNLFSPTHQKKNPADKQAADRAKQRFTKKAHDIVVEIDRSRHETAPEEKSGKKVLYFLAEKGYIFKQKQKQKQ